MSVSAAASRAPTDISLSTSKFTGIEGKATSPLVGITGSLIFSAFSIYAGIDLSFPEQAAMRQLVKLFLDF